MNNSGKFPEKDQIFIFNSAELSLIKNTFADNDILMYLIRNVFMQFPLTDVERGLLKQSLTPEVIAVLRKRIIPDIGSEFPMGQLSSLLNTLNEKLKMLSPSEMKVHFAYKKLEMDYINQQFAVLEGGTEEPIKLADLAILVGKSDEELFRDVTAYLDIVGYIDPMLLMIKNIAGTKEESPEDQKKRMTRNSSK